MGVNTSFKGGLNLNFFNDDQIEPQLDGTNYKALVRYALRILMMGWNQSWVKLVNLETLRAALIRRNPELLKEFRLAFQEGFNHLFTQLQGKQFTPQQHEQIQLYLSNCMTILPMTDMNPYESFTIPQYLDKQWQMVEYYVKPIELTHHKGKNELIYSDHDRVFAYGLEPINNPSAQSHLIFMGTTYPAGQGFLPQVTTDMKGFETVGYSLYVTGRERVREWVLNQKGKIKVCGISLGGSLSLLFAADLGNYVSRVDALNPAGLYDSSEEDEFDHWDTIQEKPEVVIQQQGEDPVSTFGIWKKDWTILHVTPPPQKRGPFSYFDHFLNYAGFADTEFTFMSPELQNKSRKYRNFWLYGLGRGIVYYFLLAPYSYIFRPLKNNIFGNWWNLSISFLVFAASITLVGILALAAIPSIVLVSIAGALAFVSGLVGITFGIALFNEKEPKEHTPVRAMPSEASQLNLAHLHHPNIPRNAELDIYKNEISFNLSYKDINTYYKVMRTMVKGKPFIPEEEKPEYSLNNWTKRELLLQSSSIENADKLFSFKTSKAKCMFMQHALFLIHKIGIEDEASLKEALQDEYRQYRLGKM